MLLLAGPWFYPELTMHEYTKELRRCIGKAFYDPTVKVDDQEFRIMRKNGLWETYHKIILHPFYTHDAEGQHFYLRCIRKDGPSHTIRLTNIQRIEVHAIVSS